MRELTLELKKLLRNRIIQIVCLGFLAVAVFDPLSLIYEDFDQNGMLLQDIGKNPFQFLLLTNSVSWGNQVYNTLFWVIAVLLTGMLFFQEQKSAALTCQVVRMGHRRYFASKIFATGLFTFVSVFVILCVNLLVTCLVFREWHVFSSYYEYLIPREGTFAAALYQVSPLWMMVGYIVLNAAALALFALFALAMQMVFRFPNVYVAIVLPVVILFLLSYYMDTSPERFHYNIRMLLQPRAASGLTEILSAQDLAITFGGWAVIDAILLFLGVRRRQEVV